MLRIEQVGTTGVDYYWKTHEAVAAARRGAQRTKSPWRVVTYPGGAVLHTAKFVPEVAKSEGIDIAALAKEVWG